MYKKIIGVFSALAVLIGITIFTTQTSGLSNLSSSAISGNQCSIESQSEGESGYMQSAEQITNLEKQITKTQDETKERTEEKKRINIEIKQIKKDLKTIKSELKKIGNSIEKEIQIQKAKIEELETRLKNKNERLKQITATNKDAAKSLRDFQTKLKEYKQLRKDYETCKKSLAVAPETDRNLPTYTPDLTLGNDTENDTAPIPAENISPKTSEVTIIEGFIDGDKEREKAGKLIGDLEKFRNGWSDGMRTYNLSEEQKGDFLKKRDELYKELTTKHDKLATIEKAFENLFAQIFRQEGQMDNLKSQLNSSEQNKKSVEKAGKKPSQQLLERIKDIEKNIKKQKEILNTSNAQLNQEMERIKQLGYKNDRDVSTHRGMIKGGLDMLDNKIIWSNLLK